tara:strand:- start:2619 stop:3845 length:1227 start_codon:yes stop_codon:yes gene_type:complete
MKTPEVIIVGAGMAGLACARTLDAAGIEVRLLESTDRVGGRLGSETRNDVCCDLGFQVSMDNYAALEDLVPRSLVPRRSFVPGAIVWDGKRQTRIVDPKHSPGSVLPLLVSGLVRPRDLIASIRCRRWSSRALPPRFEGATASDVITAAGFGDRFVECFLRPFFGGVFLDETLQVDAGRFLRTLARFASGRAELPDGGMQRLAEAMADPIRSRIEFSRCVETLTPDPGIACSDGARFTGQAVVLAGPIDRSLDLLGREHSKVEWSSTRAFHFRADTAVLEEPLIVLNGSGGGRLNLLCSPTAVADGYAAHGQHVIVASCRPCRGGAPRADVDEIRAEAGRMLGVDPNRWEFIHEQRIDRALPCRPTNIDPAGLPDRVHLIGDGLDDPSIESAVRSGVACGERIMKSMA